MAHSTIDSGLHSERAESEQIMIDPFNHFPLEITRIIVKMLEPQDTESLRRVCKSWKEFSEILNGYSAVARYCPKSTQLMAATSKNPNLCFRQWLCFEQNIRAGLAQDVALLNETTTWDIRNHLLVAGHSCGGIRILPLRQSSTTVSGLLNLNNLLWPHHLTKIVLDVVCLAEDGDIIIQFKSEERRYIAKLTTMGTIVWLAATDWLTVAVGLEYVYVVTLSNWDNCGVLITDLKSGLQISSFTIPPLNREPDSYGDLTSVLSSDGAFVLIKTSNHVLCIYDTIRKRIADIKGILPQFDGHCLICSIIPDPASSGFFGVFGDWLLPCKVYKYSYDVSTHTFKLVQFWDFKNESWAPIFGYDIARNIVFEDSMYGNELQSFGVRSLPKYHPDAFKDTQKSITVVEKDTGKKRRVTLPVDGFPEDDWLLPAFYGVHNGYLVYFSSFMRLLVVFDFWPSWGPHNA